LPGGTISVENRTGYIIGDSWINFSDAASSNNTYTASTLEGNIGYSKYLKVVNLGFSIPSGSTITGIEVNLEKFALYNTGSSYAKDSQLKLYKGGVLGGSDLANTGSNWSTTESVITYGGSSNLWGESWTYSDINATDFGVGFSVYISSVPKVANYAYLDHVSVTVYYTTGGGSSTNPLLYIGD